jgi:hypothetical protein
MTYSLISLLGIFIGGWLVRVSVMIVFLMVMLM